MIVLNKFVIERLQSTVLYRGEYKDALSGHSPLILLLLLLLLQELLRRLLLSHTRVLFIRRRFLASGSWGLDDAFGRLNRLRVGGLHAICRRTHKDHATLVVHRGC